MAIEILSPAGSFESLVAGIRCGANAVYLGTKAFNARRNAGNFDYDELNEAVSYAHARQADVHITLNTLVSDNELTDAVDTIKHICNSSADVLILQDLGAAYIAKTSAPDIKRHASTQTSVQTSYGVNLMSELGFTRVVLPRETSLSELENIRKNTTAELECFVHGALCMCVSGQCYLSAMLGSRSGNRGLCAQPCRLPFSVENGTGHDLSLKDTSLISDISKLEKAGACSAKIEGRMKRPEYVAAATKACQYAVCGEINDEINNALHAVFSRSGFTKGYLEGKLSRDMFGIRMKDDVTSAKKVLPMLERLYDKEQPIIPVDFYLSVIENETVTLSGSAMGKSYFADSGVVPEKALNKPMNADVMKQRISKCGGTPFYANDVEIDLDDGLIVPSSVINALRREVLDNLLEKLSERTPKQFVPADLSYSEHKSEKMKLYIRLTDVSQLPEDLSGIDTVYLPISTDIDKLKDLNKKIRVGVEIPRGIFSTADKVFARLKTLKENGLTLAYATNIDGLAMSRELSMEIHTGFTLNIFNTLSLNELEKLGVSEATVSVELTLQQIKKLGGNIKRGVIAYGNIPLMLTRNCPIRNGKTCDKCKSNSYLTDRMGVKFPVVCSNGCSELLNSRPIYLADRLREIENADFITLYFTKESKQKVAETVGAYLNGEKPQGEFTRGLYYRGVE